MKRHIPNILTLSNLSLGCIGIVLALKGNLIYASYTIWFAALFDFFDGFAARLLKVSSPIGKELDSLADMVSFGVLPSAILFSMASNGNSGSFAYFSFILALFSALRLAKFNVDTQQENSFIGMPTPAVAFFVSGLIFWQIKYPNLFSWPIIIGIALILSLLLVAPIKMLALKFKNYTFSSNWARYLVILSSLVLIIFTGMKSLPLIISLYFIISIVSSRFNSK